jgi:FkbM family methyltransferase
MRQQIKNLIKGILARVGIGISRYDTLQRLLSNEKAGEKAIDDLCLLKSVDENIAGKWIHLLDKSKSQLRQDLFVLGELRFKRNGFFVEFGATNGKDLSNTHLLEKEFGWQGILAEPARIWHQDLKRNRNASIDFECVWRETGKSLDFNEGDIAEYSTIANFNSCDSHTESRRMGKTYSVNSVSLIDLLNRHDAPRSIDYLSIDTEGSEFEILKAFDFDAYEISVITCEHNFTENRQDIYDLLISVGYQRKHENMSKFDDWYVLQ